MSEPKDEGADRSRAGDVSDAEPGSVGRPREALLDEARLDEARLDEARLDDARSGSGEVYEQHRVGEPPAGEAQRSQRRAQEPVPELARDRRLGLSIVAVAFLAALAVSWVAKEAAKPEVPKAPAPPTTEGLSGFPRAVDALAELGDARELSSRPLLVGLVIEGVGRDGKVDLSRQGSKIRYAFQSPRGEGAQPAGTPAAPTRRIYCGRQDVAITEQGMFAEHDDPAASCRNGLPRALPEPQCTLQQLWNKALGSGFPQQQPLRFEYYRGRIGPAWRLTIPGAQHKLELYGDCERELTKLEATGSAPP